LMRLSNGYINGRPLMDRDGSGVSLLLGLVGFVVRAQVLEESTGEWWWAVLVGLGLFGTDFGTHDMAMQAVEGR
jgi:hypothetical protein